MGQKKRKWMVSLLFVLSVHLGAAPRVCWKYQTGGQVIGSCVIAGESLFTGGMDGFLYALDKQNGTLQWKFDGKGAIRSTPVVEGNSIYFHTATGHLYALDTPTGSVQWQIRLEGETMVDVWDYYQSSPIVYDNLLIVGSGNGRVYAFDRKKGKEVWSFQTGGVVHADPLVFDNKVYIGSFDGYLYALDVMSGVVVWSFKTVGDRYFSQGAIQNGASVFEGMILFGSRDFNMYALNAQTGRGVWNRKEPGSWVVATPVASADSLLFVGTSDSHAFYCVDMWADSIKWKMNLNMRVYGKAAFYRSYVLFGCFNGTLYAVHRQTGEIAWVFRTENSTKNYDVVYDAHGKFNEALFSYSDAEGLLKAETALLNLGSFLASPVVEGDCVYIGSTDGYIYALDIRD